jgi:hypothetical protein
MNLAMNRREATRKCPKQGQQTRQIGLQNLRLFKEFDLLGLISEGSNDGERKK